MVMFILYYLYSNINFTMEPYLFARRWRAFLSPLLDACRLFWRSVISFLISLFLVSITAANSRSPSGERTAAPMFVLPGSSASVTGWRTGALRYVSRIVNGISSAIRALPVFSSFRTCLFRLVGIWGFPSKPRT